MGNQHFESIMGNRHQSDPKRSTATQAPKEINTNPMSTSLVAGRMAAVQEVLPAVQGAQHQQNSNAGTCISNRPNLLYLIFATG